MASKVKRLLFAAFLLVPAFSEMGKIVYTAGQLARDVDGNCVGKGDMRAQMEQTFQNLDRCLKAAGATWADVVKTNTFVTDFDEFQKCADIRMRYLGVATPTSTTVGVTRLPTASATASRRHSRTLSLLRRPHDHHRDLRARLRAAIFARSAARPTVRS